MATQQSTADYIAGQSRGAGDVSARKMFGEYALYCGGKLVALICDGFLFIKPTEDGRNFIGAVVETPPYKGAKASFKIDGGQIEDADWLAELVKLTAAALPAPKAKKRRQRSRPEKNIEIKRI